MTSAVSPGTTVQFVNYGGFFYQANQPGGFSVLSSNTRLYSLTSAVTTSSVGLNYLVC